MFNLARTYLMTSFSLSCQKTILILARPLSGLRGGSALAQFGGGYNDQVNKALQNFKLFLLLFVSLFLISCGNGADNISGDFQLRPVTSVPAAALNGSGEGYTAWAEGGGAVYVRRTLSDGRLETPIEIAPDLGASPYCLQTQQPKITSNNQTTIVSWVSFDRTFNYPEIGRGGHDIDAVLMVSVISNGVVSAPVEMTRTPYFYRCNAPYYTASRGLVGVFYFEVAINDNNAAMIAWRLGRGGVPIATRFFNGANWGSEGSEEDAGYRFRLMAGSTDFFLGVLRGDPASPNLSAFVYDSTGAPKSNWTLNQDIFASSLFMNKANDIFITWASHSNNNTTLNFQKYSSVNDTLNTAQIVDSYADNKNRPRLSRTSMAFDDMGNGFILWPTTGSSIEGVITRLIQCFSNGSCNTGYDFVGDFDGLFSPTVKISPDGQAVSILVVSGTRSQVRQTSAELHTLKLFRAFGSPFIFSEDTLTNAYIPVPRDIGGLNGEILINEGLIYPVRDTRYIPHEIPAYSIPRFGRFWNDGNFEGFIDLDNSHTTLLNWTTPVYRTYASTLEQAVFKASSVSLNVSINGQGQVNSDVTGISCGSDCIEFFTTGSQVVLTALPDAGHQFAGWTGTGDCATAGSAGAVLTLTVTQTSNCAVTFDPIVSTGDVTLTLVILGGPGAGQVNSIETPMPTMQCLNSAETTSTCTAVYSVGSNVTLRSSAFFPNNDVVWTGCGTIVEAGTCVLVLTQDTTVTASFSEVVIVPVYSISVAGALQSNRVVSSSVPAGITGSIDCPDAQCTDLFLVSTPGSITLQAIPAAGSTFINWGSNNPCDSVAMVNGFSECTLDLTPGSLSSRQVTPFFL